MNVIYEINKILKGFPWCQGELTKGKAKVSWESVCRPKEQRGLRIKNLQVWNEVLLVKQLWNVIAKKDILWVKWVNTENLKGKSPLCDITTSREIYEAGLSIDSTVADLVKKYEGNWLEGWNNEYPILSQCVVPNLHDDMEDKAVWVDKNGKENLFSVKLIWKDLNDEEPKVEWYKIVWFNKNITRHGFILWMALQNRLSTQDMIAMWKPNEVMQCVFYKQCMDSVEHLFFTCTFTLKAWKEVHRLLSVSMSFNWNDIVKELKRLPNNQNI
nr:hypothetical protein [Tanacetum cinerariifolium]